MKLISRTNTYKIVNGKKVQIVQVELLCEHCKKIVIRKGHNSIYSKSCGCMAKKWITTHGMSGGSDTSKRHRLYSKWVGMLNRCRNKKMSSWPRYGGRGIDVCDEWKNSFTAFRDWAISNGWHYNKKGDKKRICIDRIDNDGNYCPENCRFVSYKESNRNRSFCKINKDKAEMIKQLLKSGWKHKQIASQMKVSLGIIASISQKKGWSN